MNKHYTEMHDKGGGDGVEEGEQQERNPWLEAMSWAVFIEPEA